MSTQHTVTPWGIEDTGGAIWVGPMRRDGVKINEIVFGIDIHGHTACAKAGHRADAEFIVRACNNHEALVKALTAMLQMACEFGADKSRHPSDQSAIETARATLATATQ